MERYAANRLNVTRQLTFEAGSTKAIDLGLFVNGLLVATAELKNQLTGQSVEDAIAQYRADRDPNSLAGADVGPNTRQWSLVLRLRWLFNGLYSASGRVRRGSG